MKLYHFNPNDFGFGYFVMAENKNKAYEDLIGYLKKMADSGDQYAFAYKREFELWQRVNPLDKKTFPEKYTLDEHDEGKVILHSND